VRWRADLLGAIAFVALGLAALALPNWLVSLATIAFANALVVLGLMILWRAGLVPFGQALYYAVGAYTVALLGRYTNVRDILLLVGASGLAAGIVAYLTGILLARYREIFFAMLSMAMSMILYGILVKTETLGSTDGFHVEATTLFGYRIAGRSADITKFWIVLAFCAAAAAIVTAYFRTIAGGLAIPLRDNEVRVEFLGVSVDRLIHLKLVIAGTLAGIGGALAAIAVQHVDPQMSYWTTSGGFVFVTILAGTVSIAAAFAGSLLFELVRSFAVSVLPNIIEAMTGWKPPSAWQLILGTALLLIILFLPEGLGSLYPRLRRRLRRRREGAA
jgi:branched-chain amino acid transport system permease protein